jgi:hypothetical protein
MLSQLWQRFAWRDRDARMRAFADTEAFGARDLARAAAQVQDPWVRRQLVLHAKDEVRHASLLHEQAAPPEAVPLGAALAGATPPPADGVDIDTLGEIGFVAFVHDAELRAVAEFQQHQAHLGADGAVFASILKDEQRHVAWTAHQLDKWRAAGRGAEVDAALRKVRRGRLLALWVRVARRFSAFTSGVLLTGVFFVLLAPLAPWFRRGPGGWRPAGPAGVGPEY